MTAGSGEIDDGSKFVNWQTVCVTSSVIPLINHLNQFCFIRNSLVYTYIQYIMIFNDEPRFSKKLVAHPADGAICGVTKSATEEHVGPGSYLAEQFEERRSGWRRKSFSNRQPMEEPKNKSISRSDYYVSGVLSPNGTMATPASPARSHSPGPGYYEGPHSVFSFPTDAHVSYIITLCCCVIVSFV